LVHLPGLTKLKRLDLSNTRVTAAGIAKLRKELLPRQARNAHEPDAPASASRRKSARHSLARRAWNWPSFVPG